MRLLVWKCSRTGRYFESERLWRRHLTDYRARLTFGQNYSKKRAKAYCSIMAVKKLNNFDDVARWLVKNSDKLSHYISVDERDYRLKGFLKKSEFKIVELRFENLEWSDKCSNSHVAPNGKRTNWCGRDKNLPTSYPGYTGRIYIEAICPNGEHFQTSVLKVLGIHTGSGGGADKSDKHKNALCYDYEVTLFAEEWNTIAVLDKLWLSEGTKRA